MKLFNLFIYTSFFISVCACAMTWQTYHLFGGLQIPALYGFVFAGTICGYNFHWLLTPNTTKPVSGRGWWSVQNKPFHLLFFLTGACLSIYFFLSLYQFMISLLMAGFLTFLYSAPKISVRPFSWLRRIAIGKTIYLALVWMYVTVVLPLHLQGSALTDTQILFAVNRFFFIYAICILFDFRDREADRRQNIRSMITTLTEPGIDRLFYGSVIVAIVTGMLMMPAMGVAAALSLLFPVLVLILLYPSSKKKFSDFRYYFILDGLMMASAPLLLLVKFAGL